MIKSTKFVLLNLALIALALAAVACGDTTGNTTTSNTPANNTTTTSDSNATSDDATKDDEKKDDDKKDDEKKDDKADAGDKVGVAECDDYIAKMRACLDDKVTGPARDTFTKAFDDSMKAWKEAASTDAGKAGLATGCKAALDAAKTSMSAYNCVW